MLSVQPRDNNRELPVQWSLKAKETANVSASASITNSTNFQEPRSANLGGKISYPCKWNCCRSGNNSCTQFCGGWICDLIVLPPCIAQLSCRKLTALNSVSVLDLQQSPPNLHL
ncbi:unnamed protein product [Malus baccata var. baccata]